MANILLTGASRGIGAAIALELARHGMRVVGTATSAAGAAHISAALSAFPGCRGEVLDVTDGPAGEALINAVSQRDFPVIQGITLVTALFVTFVHLCADILISFLNPKMVLE